MTEARPNAATIPLKDQIACARREQAMRKAAYPQWVAKGKMDKEEADRELDRMSAIITTLEWLQKNEETVRAAVAAKGAPS